MEANENPNEPMDVSASSEEQQEMSTLEFVSKDLSEKSTEALTLSESPVLTDDQILATTEDMGKDMEEFLSSDQDAASLFGNISQQSTFEEIESPIVEPLETNLYSPLQKLIGPETSPQEIQGDEAIAENAQAINEAATNSTIESTITQVQSDTVSELHEIHSNIEDKEKSSAQTEHSMEVDQIFDDIQDKLTSSTITTSTEQYREVDKTCDDTGNEDKLTAPAEMTSTQPSTEVGKVCDFVENAEKSPTSAQITNKTPSVELDNMWDGTDMAKSPTMATESTSMDQSDKFQESNVTSECINRSPEAEDLTEHDSPENNICKEVEDNNAINDDKEVGSENTTNSNDEFSMTEPEKMARVASLEGQPEKPLSDDIETRKVPDIDSDNAVDITSISMDDFKGETAPIDYDASDPIGTKDTNSQPANDSNLSTKESSNNSNADFLAAEQNESEMEADNNECLTDSKDDGECILSEEQEKDTKFTITHFNSNEEKACEECNKEGIPKYIAERNSQTLYICNNECLGVFKSKNPDNYVERILRLRAFAVQDKKLCTPSANVVVRQPQFAEEIDDEPKNDSNRKCGICKAAINPDSYIAWEAVDYCNEGCLLNFQRTINSECAKCRKTVTESLLGKFCVRFGNLITQFCSTNCLLAYKKCFKFCSYCQEDLRSSVSNEFKNFCSRRCMEKCQPERTIKEKSHCAVCHQIKPVEIKIRTQTKMDYFCSNRCFVAYKFVNNVEPVKCEVCPTHFEPSADDPLMYTEDATIMLCCKECQKIYLISNRKIVICCNCSVKKYDFDMIRLSEKTKGVAYACSNNCLQVHLDKAYSEIEQLSEENIKQLEVSIKDGDFKFEGDSLEKILKESEKENIIPYHKITLTKPKAYVKQRNVTTMCKPIKVSSGVSCRPKSTFRSTQTEERNNNFYIPIPVPIFVPAPGHMYVEPIPFPTPIPIPMPVPIFIPTARKSISGIAKELQKIKNRVPADPLEAELLMMAEMAAGDKKDESSSESEAEDNTKVESFQGEATAFSEATASFGEDVLTMALKMASDFEEPSLIEGAIQSGQEADPAARIENIMESKRKSIRQGKHKLRKSESQSQNLPQSQINAELEKPDANLCLKYTFGVNAWKQWVTIKNHELQKTQRRPKLFKPEILQLTSDDLNFSLSLFVKEVRKPNGAEYAPDTIYYLCLGIQQYLYENGRIDNIFCDSFYESFTDSFNEVCQKFANLYNDSQYIVTRVEEEHLWESKQLGAHSPLVLLNTLMFFNTKHFSLSTVDEHLQLSFSHIMKHWKRNANHPGSRNVLLRFYPPQTAEGSRKKKVYEQQENDENPLRCPVKLYEFYLSKCPESVKTRNDVFYLLPERSCVPDSPVWYSTMALSREPLEKMLNRVKMVKEINVALLTS